MLTQDYMEFIGEIIWSLYGVYWRKEMGKKGDSILLLITRGRKLHQRFTFGDSKKFYQNCKVETFYLQQMKPWYR